MSDDPTAEIERIPSPEPPQLITFQTEPGEVSARCPFDFGGPDSYSVRIRYEPAEHGVESRSLKRWLQGWRNEEATAEAFAAATFEAIEEAIEPARLYVRFEQNVRGGIRETVEVGDRSLA